MAQILKGTDVANAMKEVLIAEVSSLLEKGVSPKLAIIRVGNKPDDMAYQKGAVKRCEILGITSEVFAFSEDITEEELIKEVKAINDNDKIHGILLLAPLPRHINESRIKELISPQKDADGMTTENQFKVYAGDLSGYAPCTPSAVMEMLSFANIDLAGKNVALIGRSLIVGKPLAMLLIKANATVTVCHTKTVDIEKICKSADIIIAAAGSAKMVNKSFLGKNQIIIDVGINVDENGNLCGDVDFADAEAVASLITPVPGGVGSVTTSVLAKHVIDSAKKSI